MHTKIKQPTKSQCKINPEKRKRWLENQCLASDHLNIELNGHEFEQTPGDSEGQGSLACCSVWGRKELDTT